MGHIVKGSVRNSPQTVPVEKANRNSKTLTEGMNTIFVRDEKVFD